MKSFLFALLLLPLSALANGYQTQIDNFFALYEAGEVHQAVDSVYKSNQYVSAIPDQIFNVKSQLASLEGLVGKIHYINKLADYMVGDLFVHVTYLVTYDRQPVRFEFQFFKVKEGWRIYSMSFDDDLDDDIEALARKAALESK